ncbi:unnamed protein product [Malus baccata var. baccata]
MKLIQVSSAESRASLYFLHGGVTSRTPKPRSASSAAPKVGAFSSSRPSVCGFCRTLHRNQVAMGGIVRLATTMSNAYCTGFCRSHHKAVELLSSRKIRFRKDILRPFSTCTKTLISPVVPLVIHRLAIVKSLKLASESKLLCREIAEVFNLEKEEHERKKRKKKKRTMDSGLSWADQWDNNPDPPPSGSSDKDKKKGKDGSKRSFGKAVLSFKWVEKIRKKTQKEDGQ